MEHVNRLSAALVAVGFVVVALLGATLVGAGSASAVSARTYTLRVGDRVAIPSVNQVCSVYREGGSPELFCARSRAARHQVVIFKNAIFVYTIGYPDDPAWHGAA